jgi:hypothetical protein
VQKIKQKTRYNLKTDIPPNRISGKHGGVSKSLRSFGGKNLKKIHPMSNLGSYERILKLVLCRHDGWQWNGSIWLRKGT